MEEKIKINEFAVTITQRQFWQKKKKNVGKKYMRMKKKIMNNNLIGIKQNL